MDKNVHPTKTTTVQFVHFVQLSTKTNSNFSQNVESEFNVT